MLRKKIELLELAAQGDADIESLHKWFKEQIEMIKMGHTRRIEELRVYIEKEAQKWAAEKLEISATYEKRIRELQFVEETWKKKYEHIVT